MSWLARVLFYHLFVPGVVTQAVRLQYSSVQERKALSAEAQGRRNACHLNVKGGQEGNGGVCIVVCRSERQ